MKTVYRLFSIIIILVLLGSCSTKKNRFLNRNYHAVTAEFNILYNGQIAYDKGVKELTEKFSDDFWKELAIEPINFEEEKFRLPTIRRPGSSFNSSQTNVTKATTFERSEEKAVKAIQRHSISVYGIERNPQIDEAYFLLGRSRYYTQRFIPAIESFNYIIKKYPKADLIDETKIWKAKSNIRIENEDLAIENLLKLLQKEKITDDIKEKANTALAMAYQKKDSVAAVIHRLLESAKTDKNPNQKARNLYVLGQIYTKIDKKDSARATFERLASYNRSPYRLQLEAHMALAKIAEDYPTVLELVGRYRKMLKNWDHRHHKDIIFYHLGTLETKRDSSKNAELSFKSALLFPKARPKIKSYAYEKLADLYFDTNRFVLASRYYDSVLKIETVETLRTRKIQRKYNNLGALISYENIVKRNDSILNLVLLSPEERREYFQKEINKLITADEEKAKIRKKSSNFSSSFVSSSGGKQSKRQRGKWYFYNENSLKFGKTEFERVWGNRALTDNWRWSELQTINNSKKGTNITSQGKKGKKEKNDQIRVVKIDKQYDINSYLATVPNETIIIDSIQDQRAEALYQLGLIYSEKFDRGVIATERLERLLVSYPPKSLYLKTYYLLYDLYSKQKESKGAIYGKRIVRKYPKTAYAQIISNPNKKPTNKELEEAREIYGLSYKLYKKGSFKEAISFINLSIKTLGNSSLIPKFELLRAYATGKIASKNEYKKALIEVYNRFPNSIEGRKALSITKRL